MLVNSFLWLSVTDERMSFENWLNTLIKPSNFPRNLFPDIALHIILPLTDLFTPTPLAYFLRFLGSKLRTTNHNYRTTPMRCPDFSISFGPFWCFPLQWPNNRMSTVNKHAD